MRGRRRLRGEVVTSIPVNGIDTKHLRAMDFAINTLTDRTVRATIFLEMCGISRHSSIHQST